MLYFILFYVLLNTMQLNNVCLRISSIYTAITSLVNWDAKIDCGSNSFTCQKILDFLFRDAEPDFLIQLRAVASATNGESIDL